MTRIKNEMYNQFINTGEIKTLQKEDIQVILDKCDKLKDKVKQARSLIIVLYLTGCRPTEALKLLAQDIERDGPRYIKINMKGAKNGLSRPIRLKYSLDMVKELWQYASTKYPQMKLFHGYIGKYERKHVNKKGEIKTYIEDTYKIRYLFQKLTDEKITPYFLRHNRFSRLAESGATETELRIFKGAKTTASITPYVHLSSQMSKNVAKKID